MGSWKKVVVSGSDANLKSLVVSQSLNATSITGSLLGSAQAAEIVVVNSDTAPTSSLSGSLWFNTNNLTLYVRYTDPSGSSFWIPTFNAGIPVTASYSISSSLADSASYFNTSTLATTGSNTFKGNQIISGTLVVTNSITTPEVNARVIQNGSQIITQDNYTSITAIQNGSQTWGFYPGGQFYPAGTIAGSSYGSNQLTLTEAGPAQLKGILYGAQIVTSPDQETTHSYAWNFKTDGNLEIPTGKSITGSLEGTATTASYVETAQTASFVNTALTASYLLSASAAGTSVVMSTTAPTSSVSGTLWWNSNNGNLYIQTSDPTGSQWAPAATTIALATSSSYAVTSSYVQTAQTASRVLAANVIGTVSNAATASSVGTLNQNVVISTGSITMPNRPAFRVSGAGGGKVGVQRLSGSYLIVDYQQGGGWDNATGTFTAPIAGLYQVNVVTRTATNTGGSAQLVVYKNNTTGTTGTTQIMIEYAANTTMNHTGGSTISRLEVGDTLRMVVTVGEISFDGNDNFSVAYIG